jgi:hypothetical protein
MEKVRIRDSATLLPRLAFISSLTCRFSQVCEVLLSTLSRHAESQNVALLRGLLGCLSVLLRLQPPALWTQLPEVGRTFQSLLAYTAHTKPKLRKVNIQII